MKNSRYGKTLTIVLIVIVAIIVGLLIFWGVDSIIKYNIEKDAQNGVDTFKNQMVGNTNVDLDLDLDTNLNLEENNVEGNRVDPYVNWVSPDNNITEPNGNGGTATGEQFFKGFPMKGYIDIPKTDVKYPVLEEATISAMEVSVCILTGPGLNEPGVTVISGHNYRNGLFFSDNAKLATGDVIHITDNDGVTITYKIYKKYQTTPEDALFATKDTEGKREIVLTTCTDDSQNRIIVCAREI